MNSARLFASCVVTALLLASLDGTPAFAQADGRLEATATEEPTRATLGDLRLRYGPTLRSGTYTDTGPNLSYSGVTPNDLALAGDYFPALLGGDLRLQREGFSLSSGSSRVTSGGLFRAALGPAARFALGMLKLDAMVNYGFAQLPSFGQSSAPAFATGQRHSLLLASRARFDLPFGAMVEANVEYPIALAVKDETGASGKSTGFAAGGSLGYRVATTGRFAYVALLDYQFVTDSLTSAAGATSSQTLHRVGLALEVDYLEPPPAPPPPQTGALVVTVLDEATGKPLENVSVDIEVGPRHLTVATAVDGKVIQRDLPLGPLVATATAGGYLPGRGTGEVRAGEDATLELKVRREPPKLGGLKVSFVEKETQKPVGGVKVTAGAAEYIADETGTLSLVDLPPGPVELKATAEGYRPAQEVAQVVVGQKSPVLVALLKVEKKQPAVITGLVRSTQTAAAVPATLEIPEANVKIRADAKGAFTVPLEGGTYRVIISAPGYLTQSKSVTVREGDEVIFNVDLHPVGR